MLPDIVAAAWPLLMITGAAGAGKTTALAQLSDWLLRKGRRVTAVRCDARGDLLPIRFTPGENAVRLAPVQAGTSFGPVPGACTDPDLARRAATMVATGLPDDSVLIIDDAYWLDPDSLAVLHALVRLLAGGTARCVCTTTTRRQTQGMTAMLRDLRAAALVDQVRLASCRTAPCHAR